MTLVKQEDLSDEGVPVGRRHLVVVPDHPEVGGRGGRVVTHFDQRVLAVTLKVEFELVKCPVVRVTPNLAGTSLCERKWQKVGGRFDGLVVKSQDSEKTCIDPLAMSHTDDKYMVMWNSVLI